MKRNVAQFPPVLCASDLGLVQKYIVTCIETIVIIRLKNVISWDCLFSGVIWIKR